MSLNFCVTSHIQARRTRHAGHCWRSKDEIVSDVLLWTPAYGQSKAGMIGRRGERGSGISVLAARHDDDIYTLTRYYPMMSLFTKDLHSSWMPCLINSQTLKMISQVESFLCPDKQGTPEEDGRIQQPKRCEKKGLFTFLISLLGKVFSL